MKWMLPVSLVMLWIVAIGGGMFFLMGFDLTPGAAGGSPVSWPPASRIPFYPGRIQLVMLAHPQCPCTRASLAELSEITARSDEKLITHVLFFDPSERPAHWDDENLEQIARQIPSVHVVLDRDGEEADRFGAMTSGHTLLYDGQGNLRFSGGITRGRGQAGANAGRETILSALDHALEESARTPVYGCPLRADHNHTAKDGSCDK
jgi:hypothetical protein